MNPNAPVIIGVGQVEQRVAPGAARPPAELFARAARAAAADCGGRRDVLPLIDTVAIADILSFRYRDAAAAASIALGIEPRDTIVSTIGGNSPQMFVNHFAADIQAGRRRMVLLGGAECMHSSRRARREPAIELDWYDPSTAAPTAAVLGDTRPGTNATEDSHGLSLPVTMYPLIESAIRAHSGRSIADHQVAVSEFWATFAAVSATNPHAWSRTAYSAETIRTAGPMNRMVTFPYPKLMMANLDVDQAAALILTNVETARSLGVPDEQLVYVVAGADGHDHFHVTERDRLDASPAIAATGRAALAAAGFGIDDVALLDLYSCFPAAPQIATQELGIARTDPRRLTVTGGLGFAGGPINNYVTHAIATMVEHCRRDPDALGLVHGLGWYVTKHSFGLYRATPSPDGYRAAPSPQPAVDALPRRRSIASFTGDATVEATAVPMNRDSTPLVGILSMLTDEGDRVLANTDDLDVARDLMETPWEGRRISLVADGPINRLA